MKGIEANKLLTANLTQTKLLKRSARVGKQHSASSTLQCQGKLICIKLKKQAYVNITGHRTTFRRIQDISFSIPLYFKSFVLLLSTFYLRVVSITWGGWWQMDQLTTWWIRLIRKKSIYLDIKPLNTIKTNEFWNAFNNWCKTLLCEWSLSLI